MGKAAYFLGLNPRNPLFILKNNAAIHELESDKLQA